MRTKNNIILLFLAICLFSIQCCTSGAKTGHEYLSLGNACIDQGDYKTAIIYLSEAIGLIPADAEAYNSRAFAYYNISEYDKAITDYSKAIALESDLGVAYYWRAEAYLHKGEHEKAAADRKALRSLVR